LDLSINGQSQTVADAAVSSEMPLLWVLRDVLHLTGTKYGCGIGACGACTVQLAGEAVRSCVLPLAAVQGRDVRTIESLGSPDAPHPLQRAWVLHQVPQCGYCQSGMLMAAAALLAHQPKPSDADIEAAITNLCRCGTYPRVRAAIHTAALSIGAPARPARPAAPLPSPPPPSPPLAPPTPPLSLGVSAPARGVAGARAGSAPRPE